MQGEPCSKIPEKVGLVDGAERGTGDESIKLHGGHRIHEVILQVEINGSKVVPDAGRGSPSA